LTCCASPLKGVTRQEIAARLEIGVASVYRILAAAV
jgi:DNA-binding transcriptional regulator LsrR (DeoR family)